MTQGGRGGGAAAAPGSGARRRDTPPTSAEVKRRSALTAAAAVVAAAAIASLSYRITQGVDLQAEGFAAAVPWRWATGSRPFVDEMNLLQVAGLFLYPFVKAYAVVTGGSDGIVLYLRQLYVVFVLVVGGSVAVHLRRHMRWQYAVTVGATFMTFVMLGTPQLTYATMAAGLLSVGAALGTGVVLPAHDRGARWRWLACAAGVAHGLAVAVYPVLVLTLPVYAVALAFALGEVAPRRLVRLTPAPDVAAPSVSADASAAGADTGRLAWRAVSGYAAGAALPLLVVVGVSLLFGWSNLTRDFRYQMQLASDLGQLGGAHKSWQVLRGVVGLLWESPLVALLLVALLVLLRLRPRVARPLVLLAPLAAYVAGRDLEAGSSGFAVLYGLAAVYVFVFVTPPCRLRAARMLVWLVAPALAAGFLTAYTGAAGYEMGAVGVLSAFMATGAFLVWTDPAGERTGEGDGGRHHWWLVMLALMSAVAATIVLQLHTLPGGVAWRELTTTVRSGPYQGVKATPWQAAVLDDLEGDLGGEWSGDTRLLVFYEAPGAYLFWRGPAATNTAWLVADDPWAPLPHATQQWFRRRSQAPDVVLRVIPGEGGAWPQAEGRAADVASAAAAHTPEELAGGLSGFEVTAVRDGYVLLRRTPGVTDADVLNALPSP